MNNWLRILAILTCLLTAACQSPIPVTDQRPGFVAAEQLRSTIWIGFPRKGGIGGFASAVILDANHLMTNAHVWANQDPWWVKELPDERELSYFVPSAQGNMVLENGEGVVVNFPDQLKKAVFYLVAAGDLGVEPGLAGELVATNQQSGDWVVIKTDTPFWEHRNQAVIHLAAKDLDWEVPEGQELFVAGYSAIFMDDVISQNEETSTSAKKEGWTQLADFIREGPYTLIGNAHLQDGQPLITYPVDSPTPEGHSGGGVYLWNSRQEQLELIGIFHSSLDTTVRTTRTLNLLGMPLFGLEVTSEEAGSALSFAPISAALLSLRLR